MNSATSSSDSSTTISIPFTEASPGAGDIVVAVREVGSGTLHRLPATLSRFRIGSGDHADIRIDDPYVSASHCLLERPSAARLIVTDTGSKNGLYANGMRVRAAELRPGSELRVGRTALTLLSERVLSAPRAEQQLIGQSPELQAALSLARRAARSGGDCSVLILGETGTGKELIAQMIHENSPRANGPFVTLNCGGLTSSLIASELFGHTRGAYTDASSSRPGVFVQADRGTLFLDEVGELPLEQQPHLLRALESGEVRPLGSTDSHRVSVRFIAATNRLDVSTRQRLRTDLYHRLATIIIRLPPLRARPSDIPLLVREFVRREGEEREISTRTMLALQTYPWHGNVRELRHAVKRALALSHGELTLSAFLPELGDTADPNTSIQLRDPKTLYEDGVKQVLQAALIQYGSMRAAARALGVPKSTFADRARRLGLLGG